MKTKFLTLLLLTCLNTHLSAFEYYISAWGGATFADNSISGYSIDFDEGPTGGLMFGVKCPFSLRVEIEGSYRHNHFKDIKVKGIAIGVAGNLREFAAFTNIIYDISTIFGVTPFVGCGVGWEYQKAALKLSRSTKLEENNSSFASQVIGGISYRCNSCISLFLSYRHYFCDDDIHSGSLGLGISYHL